MKKKIKYKCDICKYPLTYSQEFHGKCPRCGATAFERHTTRKTKMRLKRKRL